MEEMSLLHTGEEDNVKLAKFVVISLSINQKFNMFNITTVFFSLIHQPIKQKLSISPKKRIELKIST
jgi:hypothetical protein